MRPTVSDARRFATCLCTAQYLEPLTDRPLCLQPVSTTQLLTGIPFNTSSAVGLVPLTLSASPGTGGVQVGSLAIVMGIDEVHSTIGIITIGLLPYRVPCHSDRATPPMCFVFLFLRAVKTHVPNYCSHY